MINYIKNRFSKSKNLEDLKASTVKGYRITAASYALSGLFIFSVLYISWDSNFFRRTKSMFFILCCNGLAFLVSSIVIFFLSKKANKAIDYNELKKIKLFFYKYTSIFIGIPYLLLISLVVARKDYSGGFLMLSLVVVGVVIIYLFDWKDFKQQCSTR